jgi:predicted helicase
MDGMRKCLAEEFSSIYVFNLRGNCRLQGEARRKEKDNVFGLGSRTPVAVTVLVKNPARQGDAEIFYSDIGDYLSREKKLEIIAKRRDILNPDMEWKKIVPNDARDWLNQRTGAFADFIPIGDKNDKANLKTFFVPYYSRGLASGRDVWCYNSSAKTLKSNIREMVRFYNEQREAFHEKPYNKERENRNARDIVDNDSAKISWTAALLEDLSKNKPISYKDSNVVVSSYRPFFKQYLYYDRSLNERVYQIPKLYPTPDIPNQVICVSGLGGTKAHSTIITDVIPDLNCLDAGTQCFPLYWYENEVDDSDGLFGTAKGNGKVINGYVRHDGIADWVLDECGRMYGKEIPITKKRIFHYVYGVLHSPDYRETFAADLKKALPRIPLAVKADDFLAFAEAGKALAKLHLRYETVKPYPAKVIGAESERFRVEKMRFGKVADGKPDRTVIQFNDLIRVEKIPLETYKYIVNGKSAIEWVMERYQVKADKESGLKNDPNDWSEELGGKYALDLLLRVTTVSLETIRIVKGLPILHFA